MSVYFLLMTCLVGSALATTTTVPSDINICGRLNPKFDECVKTTVQNLAPKLKKGIPEWNVPSIDPFDLENITLADSATLKSLARSVKFHGLSEYVISELHFDLKALLLNCKLHFDQIKFTADHNLSVKFGSVAIAGEGPLAVVAKGVEADVKMQMKMTEYKGEPYMFIRSLTMKLEIGDYDATVGPSEKTDITITETINSLLQTEKDLFKTEIIPSIEKSVSEVILEFGNKFCRNVPASVLLPDRE